VFGEAVIRAIELNKQARTHPNGVALDEETAQNLTGL
jgi:hypothetical protein